MKEYTENGIRVLEPDEGVFLTDGQTYSEKVYLGKNADPAAWTETEWDGAYPDEDEDEATEKDYQNALVQMGVNFDENA